MIPQIKQASQLFCDVCNKNTNTKEPVVLHGNLPNKIRLTGLCCNCNESKRAHWLNNITLPPISPNHRIYINNIITPEGRFIPIFPIVDKYINVY